MSDPKRTLTSDTIGIRFCSVRPLGQRRSMTQGETSMKKHKLLIAVIMFGLTWAGIVRAEDQPIEQQTSRRFFSSTAHGRILQVGTASSISCSKTVTPSEPYRILCADSPQTLPSSQRISNPSPDPLFW